PLLPFPTRRSSDLVERSHVPPAGLRDATREGRWRRRRAGDRSDHDAGRADGRRKRTLRAPARAPDRFPAGVLPWITDGARRFADRRAPEPGAGAPTANKG